MAFVRLALFPDWTEREYALLSDALADVPVPEARRVFAAGHSPDGWRVVQVWDGRAEFDEFNRRWFFPALRAAGVSRSAPVVHDFFTRDLVLAAGGPPAGGGRGP